MLERVSPLAECQPVSGLSHRPCATLQQYHAWPDRYADMARMLAAHCGAANAPLPGKAVHGTTGSLLRVHPQRLWFVADRADAQPDLQLAPDMGAMLELSHARTAIRVTADAAVPLLSRFIAIDLRPDRFAVDDVAVTPLHRVSAVLWRRADGIDIMAPRSFARSIWELLAETAERLR
jgi:methylglutamate dehydrogenase subunit D